ncbi:hypothetical protein PGT21_003143 [Puccinia graminis f. sp. tritici]|uniref:Uncharacterized protein n=1 Tax=Puccinia graminis f. sp. tritici TaxID=56615 RepID=A0A5B0Q9L7_PUCGR|nr:hypothetical protein PGT21_003143 [Puccinia graminis f. sp. tritici]
MQPQQYKCTTLAHIDMTSPDVSHQIQVSREQIKVELATTPALSQRQQAPDIILTNHHTPPRPPLPQSNTTTKSIIRQSSTASLALETLTLHNSLAIRVRSQVDHQLWQQDQLLNRIRWWVWDVFVRAL